MREYSFIVKGKPVGFKRPDNRWQGGRRTPDDYRAYRLIVSMIAGLNAIEPMDHVFLTVNVYIPCRIKPMKRIADKVLEPKRRTDIDNIGKCVMDALNGIAYKDDVSVVALNCRYWFMRYKTEPYIEVIIQETTFEDNIDGSNVKEQE